MLPMLWRFRSPLKLMPALAVNAEARASVEFPAPGISANACFRKASSPTSVKRLVPADCSSCNTALDAPSAVVPG
jgi:hypothetical protein